MKPITLKITGLNSFIKEQTIDFKTLTDTGLFGIFGPTGSGKSTILDAITIVLFGEIVRKNRDFMNTNCDTLSVSYEFEIGLGVNRKCYIAERNFRRDKKGSIKTKYARLMEKNESEELCMIAEKPTEVKKEVEKIVGLTIDDFTRSVVLPQGKFSEFLKLKGREKRDMLERIFGLEKYGKQLGEKIKKARNIELKKQSELNGALKRFEGISEESYKEKEQELQILKNEEKEMAEKKKKVQTDYEKYQGIWNLQKEMKTYEEKFKGLDDKKEEMEKRKIQSIRGENALFVKPHIDERIKIEEEFNKNNEKLVSLEKQLEGIKEQIIIIEGKYKKSLEKKDHEIPIYINKESELKRAIEIEKEMKDLEKERKLLIKQYHEQNDKKKEMTKKLAENEETEKTLKENLKDQEKRVSMIKIDLSYREKIEKSLEIENNYNSQQQENQKLRINLEEKRTSYKSNEKEHEKVVKLQDEKKNKLNELLKKQKGLQNNCPGNDENLLKAQANLTQLKSRLDEKIKDTEKRDALNLEYKKIDKERRELEIRFNQWNEALQEKERMKKALEEEIAQIERENAAAILAANLKDNDPCPVCGAIHHIHLAVGVDAEILEKKREEKKSLEGKIKEIDKNLRGVEKNFDYAKKEINRLEDEIKLLEEKLKEIHLETLKKSYKENEKDFETLKKDIDIWKKNKEELEDQLNELKDEKNKIDQEEARLREGVKKDKGVLEGLEEEFSQKHKTFETLSKDYEVLKKELNIESFSDEMNRIKKGEKEIEKIQKNQKELRNKIEQMEPQTKELNGQISQLNEELRSITDVGQEKRKNIDIKAEEMKKITEGKDPSKYMIEVKNKIQELNDTVKKLNDQLENEKNKREEIVKDVTSKSQNKRNLIQTLQKQRNRLEELLKEHDFENEEDVLEAFITKEEIDQCNKVVEGYENELRNTLDNMNRIKKQLNNESIDEDTWNKILEDKKNYEKLIEEKHRKIGALESILNQIKKDLKELKELNKKYKEVQHQLSLLYDIDKLIQGNKFVEFVAMNQLKYIAREASRRLLSITANRYALEIDDEGNFTVRDDKNGGVVRETASLSGGETFLTSLALALSLSSQIQLKGSAPLEFFFLDEGFGTLDANLLEVVMTSLEKLHTDKLSVGIISHVEELKNRVPVKILVTPGEEGVGGSCVKLEYS
ncbi:AAA family ATPase [Crassaminicella profunda]|uniref:AAA family ATPase n=1 Tax=Crassaminicella profunda TaxID=1286698 RepID=UPI001CA60A38|nr:AAA family ATPase [Crassaminicella profunda]QZY55888.1 AAA family ATPase [Crassaminicella profunda]